MSRELDEGELDVLYDAMWGVVHQHGWDHVEALSHIDLAAAEAGKRCPQFDPVDVHREVKAALEFEAGAGGFGL